MRLPKLTIHLKALYVMKKLLRHFWQMVAGVEIAHPLFPYSWPSTCGLAGHIKRFEDLPQPHSSQPVSLRWPFEQCRIILFMCLPRLNLKNLRQQALLLATAHYAGLAKLAEQPGLPTASCCCQCLASGQFHDTDCSHLEINSVQPAQWATSTPA